MLDVEGFTPAVRYTGATRHRSGGNEQDAGFHAQSHIPETKWGQHPHRTPESRFRAAQKLVRGTAWTAARIEDMTPEPRRLATLRRQRSRATAAAIMASAVIAGCTTADPAAQHDTGPATVSTPVPVGECAALHGDGHDDALSAAVARCGDGMTYTVAAHTDVAGNCPSPADATVFVEPFADRLTARLCMVPNLMTGQCYAFGIPTGIYAQTPCASAGAATIRIEERFEVSDAHACTDAPPSRTMVYRSVPRTYCLSYPGIGER